MKPNEESNPKDNAKMVLYIGVVLISKFISILNRYKLLKDVECPSKWNIRMIGVWILFCFVFWTCWFIPLIFLELGEILSIKNRDDEQLFYIHYSDCNKRLDEWVSQDRLDLKHIQYPKRETKGSIKNGSRQSSPDRETSMVISVCDND